MHPESTGKHRKHKTDINSTEKQKRQKIDRSTAGKGCLDHIWALLILMKAYFITRTKTVIDCSRIRPKLLNHLSVLNAFVKGSNIQYSSKDHCLWLLWGVIIFSASLGRKKVMNFFNNINCSWWCFSLNIVNSRWPIRQIFRCSHATQSK